MLSVLTSVALGILPYVRPIIPAAQEYRGMGTSSLDIDPAGPIDVPPRTVDDGVRHAHGHRDSAGPGRRDEPRSAAGQA